MSWKRSLLFAASVAGLMLAGGVSARADFGEFSYTSTVSAANDPTLPANPPGAGTAVVAIGNGNSLTFTTNTVTGIDGTIDGGADINFGTIVFNAGNTNTVTAYAVNFNYAVTITDDTSGATGTVNFTGQVAGNARGTPRAINSDIFSYNVEPASLTLNGTTYQITTKNSTGPGSLFDGVLQGNVTAVPEPASLALLGLGGLGVLGLIRHRKAARA